MLRKPIAEQSFTTDRSLSVDPLDGEIIERLFKKDLREGEEKLMLAVLASAIQQFQKYVFSKNEKGRILFQEAEEWFLERGSDGLFSFEYICETLRLHPDYIRQGLMSWKKARPKEHSLQGRRRGRAKLVKTRVAYTSLRFYRTA